MNNSTSFYNKYYLNNTNKGNNVNSENINILKKDFTLNYSDYQKLKISEQYNKLYSNIYDKNQVNIEQNENKKIYNLSFNDLINKSGIVYINLLNDLALYFSINNKDKNINKLGQILVKDDNLIYIGLLILVLSFLLWLINITS
jgi:hypothetical protein